MYGQVAQLTLEPNGLSRLDDILVIFSFLASFFCVVRHFRISLLNNPLLRHSPSI